MISNTVITTFFRENYLFIGLFVLLIIRIIPPKWAGFYKYKDNKKAHGRALRITPLRFILHSLVDSLIGAFLIPILSMFGLKHMVTLVILAVVIINIFFQHQISGPAVTLVGIGIVTLYLDKLIETGKSIKLFGGLVSWERQYSGLLPQIQKIEDKRKVKKIKKTTKTV